MPNAQQEQILNWVSRWKKRLLLNGWTVITNFESDPCENQPNLEYTLADMVVNQRYTEGKLTVYPAMFREHEAAQELCIAHELIHIQTEELRVVLEKAANKGIISQKKAADLSEGVTEYITKLLWKKYDRSKKAKQVQL